MTTQERINNYVRETGFPACLFVGADGRIVGTWIMGNDYRVKSNYYGGYPAGYLKRIKALFPDKKQTRTLHLFAGKVATDTIGGFTLDSNAELEPTFVDDAHTMESVNLAAIDFVLADPPYSTEDCVHYGTPMVNRNKVMKTLGGRLPIGAHVVWLDQVLPMYRKDQFKIIGVIGMVKSTNHRFRVVTIFERITDPAFQ